VTYRDLLSEYNLSRFERLEILSFVSGKSKADIIRDIIENCPDGIANRAREIAERRQVGEPLAYILGEWDFYGLRLKITPDVLIPRVDSEELVSAVLDKVIDKNAELEILDLCSGSGCLGLALLSKLPNASLTAVDISEAALELARQNSEILGFSDRVKTITADVLRLPVERFFNAQFSILISNPPYVTASEMKNLDRSVADYEPHIALFGGEDGLDFYRAIKKHWSALVVHDGIIGLECGFAQGETVKKIFDGKAIVIATGG